MDSVKLAKSLGKDIPAEALETIAGMTTKAQVLYYCRRFPMAAKAAPKAAPKESPKAAPKEAPKVVTRRQEG